MASSQTVPGMRQNSSQGGATYERLGRVAIYGYASACPEVLPTRIDPLLPVTNDGFRATTFASVWEAPVSEGRASPIPCERVTSSPRLTPVNATAGSRLPTLQCAGRVQRLARRRWPLRVGVGCVVGNSRPRRRP